MSVNSPGSICDEPVSHKVYVPVTNASTVRTIDATSNTLLSSSITVGGTPSNCNLTADGQYLLTSNTANVSIIDLRRNYPNPLMVVPPITPVVDSMTVPAPGGGDYSIFVTENQTPSFNVMAASNYSGAMGDSSLTDPRPTVIYYNVDGMTTPPMQTAAPTDATGTPTAHFMATVPRQRVGVHYLNVYAAYGDEAKVHETSSSPQLSLLQTLQFMVRPTETSTKLTADYNPQVVDNPVTFTATVAPLTPQPNGFPLTGQVNFAVGGVLLCGTGSLQDCPQLQQLPDPGNAGAYIYQATLTVPSAMTAAAGQLALGPNDITATYYGDTSYSESESGTYTENIVDGTATTLTSASPNPQTYGLNVTFTATVTVDSGDAGGPALTGTVSFYDGGTLIGTSPITLVGGNNYQATADFSTSSLVVGPHIITAVYSGDTHYGSSESNEYPQEISGVIQPPPAIGLGSYGVGVNPATNTTYIANSGSNTVSVINGVTAIVSSISVGRGPYTVAVDPVTNTAYVSNTTDGTVSVIDGASKAVTATVPVGMNPAQMAVDAAAGYVYVVNTGSSSTPGSSSVSAINVSNPTAVTTLALASGAWGIAVNPTTHRVYVSNGVNSVSVIRGLSSTNSTLSLSATVYAGANPSAIAVNPVTTMIYVANYWDGTVSVIDGTTNTVVATPAVGTNPASVAVNSVTNWVYVANYASGSVTAINGATNASLPEIATDNGPIQLAINPLTNQIFVVNSTANTVSVIDGGTNTVTTPSPAYSTISYSGGTSTIATNQPALASNSWGVGVNVIANKVYISTSASPIVATVLSGDTNALYGTITGLSSPYYPAFNPLNGEAYIGTNSSFPNTSATSEPLPTVYAVQGASIVKRIYVPLPSAWESLGIPLPSTWRTGSTSTACSTGGGDVDVLGGRYISLLICNGGDYYLIWINANSDPATDDTFGGLLYEFPVGVSPTNGYPNTVTGTYFMVGSDAMMSVISASGELVNQTSLGGIPNSGIALLDVDSASNKVYAIGYTAPPAESSNLYVFDGTTGNQLPTVALAPGAKPQAVSVDRYNNKVYILNGDSTVDVVDPSVIDPVTNNYQVTTLSIANPSALTFGPTSVLVTQNGTGITSFTTITSDTNEIAPVTGSVTGYVTNSLIDPISGNSYFTIGSNVAVVDGATFAQLASTPVGSSPYIIDQSVDYSMDVTCGLLYVGNTGSGSASVIQARPAAGNYSGVYIDSSTQQAIQCPNAAQQPLTVTSIVGGTLNQLTGPQYKIYSAKNYTPQFTVAVNSNYTGSGVNGYDTGKNLMPTAVYFSVDGRYPYLSAPLIPGTVAPCPDTACATITIPPTRTGVHSLYIYAAYGDEGKSANYSSTSDLSVIGVMNFAIIPIPSTTMVTATPYPQVINRDVTLTATVVVPNGDFTPTGLVEFRDGGVSGTVIGQGYLPDCTAQPTMCSSDGTNDSYIVQVVVNTLSLGSHTIAAIYYGDATFGESYNTTTERIVDPTIVFIPPYPTTVEPYDLNNEVGGPVVDGTPYTQLIQAYDDAYQTAAYSITLAGGGALCPADSIPGLPGGLTWGADPANPNDKIIITGTPMARAGIYCFTVTASDNTSIPGTDLTATQVYTITLEGASIVVTSGGGQT
ncbi:MAG: Ig-like domain repeat protein, partial [Acidobacteriaceae bacterium]|nr:Ig-like domain repeat protein [Acidobacteriaceae bacterium]